MELSRAEAVQAIGSCGTSLSLKSLRSLVAAAIEMRFFIAKIFSEDVPLKDEPHAAQVGDLVAWRKL